MNGGKAQKSEVRIKEVGRSPSAHMGVLSPGFSWEKEKFSTE